MSGGLAKEAVWLALHGSETGWTRDKAAIGRAENPHRTWWKSAKA
jgi:hypothetical protein